MLVGVFSKQRSAWGYVWSSFQPHDRSKLGPQTQNPKKHANMMFWCKFGEDVCNSQDELVTACSFVWKLEARVGSEKVSMFAKRTFNVTNLFFLDSDWSGHSSKCAFVGWIFTCWLCGHVFKCCKHVAMHFIVNVENLIQVMALTRSFFHFSPFCMSGVCWRLKIPSSQQTGQCEIPHHPRVPWRISVYQDESGGVCPQQSASGGISRV